jgi:hypothetical protein
MNYHQDLLPYIINMIADDSDEIKEKCVYTIDNFANFLNEELEPYSKNIMINALNLLTKGKRNVQEMSIPIITSVATALGEVKIIIIITIIIFKKIRNF